jgi:hypothetical protein
MQEQEPGEEDAGGSQQPAPPDPGPKAPGDLNFKNDFYQKQKIQFQRQNNCGYEFAKIFLKIFLSLCAKKMKKYKIMRCR